MLPNMFTNDFGKQVQRFATLIDAKSNQFEVLVEGIDGSVFFSKGWKSFLRSNQMKFMGSAWVLGFLLYLWIK
jgi:hypothetical protein